MKGLLQQGLDNWSDWFAGRALQEQRILRWGIPVILLFVLYLLIFQPILSGWMQRQALLEQRLNDLDWLRAQSELVARTNSTCDARGEPLDLSQVESEVVALGRRLSLQPSVRRVTGEDQWLVTLENSQGNRLLGFTRSLVCAGLVVSRLEFQSDQSADLGRGVLTLEVPSP